VGTLFPATVDRLESRKRWMLAGLSLRGAILIDEGAAGALRHQNKSLLPAGVRDVRGDFERGDAVELLDPQGRRVGYGIANYGSADILRIRGMRSDRIEAVLGHHYGSEVVHRDNMVCL
jgi:glutamate 5-kinase